MTKTFLSVLAAALLLGSATVCAQEEVVSRDILEISLYGGLAVPVGGIADFATGMGLPLQQADADKRAEVKKRIKAYGKPTNIMNFEHKKY